MQLNQTHLNKMAYNHVNVALTPGQLKKLQAKHAVSCGTTIILKHDQLSGGPNKISLTKTQLNHLKKAKAAKKELEKISPLQLSRT